VPDKMQVATLANDDAVGEYVPVASFHDDGFSVAEEVADAHQHHHHHHHHGAPILRAVVETAPVLPKDKLVWYNIVTLTLWHIGALYAIRLICAGRVASSVSALGVALWWASGLGITAGAHRLWAHKSYSAKLELRVFLAALNSMAFQGSIHEWARDHRTHHKGSDTTADPHNMGRGFFFAHMGWVCVRKHPDVFALGRKIPMDDLEADAVVAWQKRHYLLSVLAMCYVAPALLGAWLQGGPDGAWAGFWVAGVLRHVWVLHMTWLVNSAAHMWGDKPYDPESKPSENLLVSIGAIGEGWHNYHHKFPSDYAAGEYDVTQGSYNPTKLFIDCCAALGLVTDRKRQKRSTLAGLRVKNARLASQRGDLTCKQLRADDSLLRTLFDTRGRGAAVLVENMAQLVCFGTSSENFLQ